MKTILLKNWNTMRVLRLVLGIFIVWQSGLAHDWGLTVMGTIFTLLALLNIGCCGTSTCSRPTHRQYVSNEKITYEELK